MVLSPLLMALVACSTSSSPPAALTSEPLPMVAAAPEAPQARQVPDGPAAPALLWHGLTVGAATATEVDAWIAERGLTCKSAGAMARESQQVRCSGDLPVTVLPDRKIGGRLTTLLFSGAENGPIHHISTLRKYSIPDRAIEDYASAVSALTAQLGPPQRSQAVTDPERLSTALARWATDWAFADLTVRLSIMKGAGEHVTVTEVWETPGVEATIASRPGVRGHGAAKPAANPHVVDDADDPGHPAPGGSPSNSTAPATAGENQ